MSLNRRTLFAGAAAAAMPAVANATPPDLAEVIAIYKDLNPERRARKLAYLRDCLTAQRLFERDKAGGGHA